MPGIRQDFSKTMVKDMYEAYWDGEKYDTEPIQWSKVWQEKPIDGAYDQSTSLVDMEEYEETPETEGYNFRSGVEGYTSIGKPRTFTSGREYTEEAIEDQQKVGNDIKAYCSGWGRGKNRTQDKFFANFYNYGGLTAGNDIFDGSVTNVITDASGKGIYDGTAASPVPWFVEAASHTSIGKGTYGNGKSLSFSAENLETLYKLMTDTNSYNENDERINIIPDYIMYPTALQFEVRRVLESTLIPGKGNNDTNVLQNILEPIMNPYLTNAEAFFIGKKKKGKIALMRRGVKMGFYHDEDKRRWKGVSSLRFGGYINNWRFDAGSKYATA